MLFIIIFVYTINYICIIWTGIEVVITGLTRNQFVGNSGTWVRIPPCPPNMPKPPYLRRFCFILHDFYTILFKISTARSSSLGYRWEYVFHVILTSVWPKRRAISCIFMRCICTTWSKSTRLRYNAQFQLTIYL